MKKTLLYLFNLITLIALTCNAMNIETGREMPLKMREDNTVAKDYLPNSMNMNIFLISKDRNDNFVAHIIKKKIDKSDSIDVIDYQADKAIIKIISSQKKLENLISNNIFNLALNDSITNYFNNAFWELNTKTNTYTIILPAPYIENIPWKSVKNIKNRIFKSLWINAQSGINYYLKGYQENTWPLRSWSGYVQRFLSDPGGTL